jgi:hypothetical protein
VETRESVYYCPNYFTDPILPLSPRAQVDAGDKIRRLLLLGSKRETRETVRVEDKGGSELED